MTSSFPLLTVCQPLSTSFRHKSLFFIYFTSIYYVISPVLTPVNQQKKKSFHTLKSFLDRKPWVNRCLAVRCRACGFHTGAGPHRCPVGAVAPAAGACVFLITTYGSITYSATPPPPPIHVLIVHVWFNSLMKNKEMAQTAPPVPPVPMFSFRLHL